MGERIWTPQQRSAIDELYEEFMKYLSEKSR